MTDKKLSEMKQAERDAAIKSAVRRFQQELDRSAEALSAVLAEFDDENDETS